MRRLIATFVIAVLAALYVGYAIPSTGAAAAGHTVSLRDLSAEEAEISHNKILGCFIAGTYGPILRASTTSLVTNSAAVAWSAIRVEGLALEDYVSRTYHFQPRAADLTAAGEQLGTMLVNNATRSGLACASENPATAMAQFSPRLRLVLENLQAATTQFNAHQAGSWSTSTAGLTAYYSAHAHNYETVCLSLALVADTQVPAFSADRAAGVSPVNLIKKYSQAASASSGGAYGCFPPASSVPADTASVATGQFTKAYPYAQGGMSYSIFFLVTSRQAAALSDVATVVYRDVFDYNNRASATFRATLVRDGNGRVNPHQGQLIVGASSINYGGPATLDASLVPGATALAGAAQG